MDILRALTMKFQSVECRSGSLQIRVTKQFRAAIGAWWFLTTQNYTANLMVSMGRWVVHG